MKTKMTKCVYVAIMYMTVFFCACEDETDNNFKDNKPCELSTTVESINTPLLKAIGDQGESDVKEMNEFGGANLNVTPQEMTAAGFDLGDVLTVTVNGKKVNVPYYDGLYSKSGEMQLTAQTDHIEFTAPFSGLPDSLQIIEGTVVTLEIYAKAQALDIQKAMSAIYSDIRTKYASDEIFANARMVKMGRIATGRLFRSASPFDNSHNRAAYASDFLKQNKVECVLDLADNESKLQGFAATMPEYSRQLYDKEKVIACKINANYKSDDINKQMIEGFVTMVGKPGPYEIHCLEGKDRTGIACALLEGLCGATYQEIVDDYMLTYDNYYGYNKNNNPTFYNTMVNIRLNDALMYICNAKNENELKTINLEESIKNYILSLGINNENISAIQKALCE